MPRGFRPVDVLKRWDRDFSSLTLLAAIRAAQSTVDKLQDKGPSWTGRFSNSWQITGPQGQQVKGNGQPGDPRRLRFKEGPFTGPQAAATFLSKKLFKDKVVFKIFNFSDHALKAIDAVEQSNFLYPRGWAINPDGPSTQQGKSNFESEVRGRKGGSSYRGDIGGGDSGSSSSRTAPLDWFATFANGGDLDKTVEIEIDKMLRKAFK